MLVGGHDQNSSQIAARPSQDHINGLSERFEDFKRQNALLSEENTMIQNEMARLRANLAEINSPGTLFEDNSRNHPDNGNYNKSPVKVLVPEVVNQETQATNTETLVESLPLYGRTPMSSLKDLQKILMNFLIGV